MKISKNLHAIWITFNGKLPDEVIASLEAWRYTLPQDWNFCVWCNLSEIEPKYVNYLQSMEILVLDVREIILSAPHSLKEKLQYFLEYGQLNACQNIKLFSDIMRMLLMSMRGSHLFSGIYIDITGAVPSLDTTEKLETLALRHGFSFRLQGRAKRFDSNVSIFSPCSELASGSLAKKFIDIYFARLNNWSLDDLIATHNITKCAVTNIRNLLHTNLSDASLTTLVTGDIISTEDIDAGALLVLPPDQGDPELHFTRELDEFRDTPNISHRPKLVASSIVFPFTDDAVYQCPTPVPMFSPFREEKLFSDAISYHGAIVRRSLFSCKAPVIEDIQENYSMKH